VNANDAAEMEAYARVLAKYREAFREDPPARAWPAIARNEEDMEEDLEEEARRGRLVVRVVPKNEQSGSASGASDGEKLSDELTSAMEGDAATTGAPREARRLPGESDATFELRKKAEGGDADAQCKLGVEHYGAERYEEAVKWYRQAAEKGHAAAQNRLGNCYCDGHGVEKNLVEAVKLFRQAAEHGYVGAQYNLGVCYYHGEGEEKNMAEAVKWFHQAAEQGDADAQYDLGRCYYFSYGHCERDLGKAEHWLAKAVENGYKRSEGLLKEVRELMNLEVAAAEKKTAAAAKKAAAAEKRKAAAAAKTAAKRAKR
jgi:TPR repeat protein